ncbi:hypothetical protein [Solibacillus cecembensis]|uniref:hypothetical protein n=1 Tax=Solibacillus cecembensis TaxID=459347 RepID=UPI003D008E74
MNKRGAGVIFIAIAAFLFASKYMSAAIFGSGVLSWDEPLFSAMLSYVGEPLSICSMIALILGVAYICWGEYEEFTIKKQQSNK